MGGRQVYILRVDEQLDLILGNHVARVAGKGGRVGGEDGHEPRLLLVLWQPCFGAGGVVVQHGLAVVEALRRGGLVFGQQHEVTQRRRRVDCGRQHFFDGDFFFWPGESSNLMVNRPEKSSVV